MALIGSATLSPLAAWAGKVYRIGFLRAGQPSKAWVNAFKNGLQEQGFIVGQNVLIEFKLGSTDQLPQLAEELVRSSVDVILASASSAAVAAKRATTSIPIVMAAVYSPVEVGIVPALGRPGDNITGTAVTAGDMAGKRLQLLRELLPTSRRVAMLSHVGHASNPVQIEAVEIGGTPAGRAVRVGASAEQGRFCASAQVLARGRRAAACRYATL